MSDSNSVTTRAQWVVPKRQSGTVSSAPGEIRKSKFRVEQADPLLSRRQPFQDLNSQASSSSVITYTSDESRYQRLTHTDSDKRADKDHIDGALCKTICIIVEQYLKELREHQRQIDSARSKLAKRSHHSNDELDSNFIGHKDVNKLRVRDEQTKAIDTIKQLTNYLKELSTIKRQESGTTDLVSEQMYDKLSDLRNEIIHTLNDFVLSNSDIDVPIVGPDDAASKGRGNDLCVEASSNREPIGITQESCNSNHHQERRLNQQPIRGPLSNHSSNSLTSPNEPDPETNCGDKYKLSTIHDDHQLNEFDRRRREIHQLERDTVELRNLFVDFYNLVNIQGEQVDNIEDNFANAAQQVSEGKNHLEQSMKGLTVLLPMTGCITGALIGGPIGFIVGGKLGGVTMICATSLLGFLSSLGIQRCSLG